MILEALRTSETSVYNYFTRQYIPEDNSEHNSPFCPQSVIMGSVSFQSFAVRSVSARHWPSYVSVT
jgi:hypothetical protein